MASPGTYQHWLPQAYLRGFTASRGTLERYGLVGKHGDEVVFVAKLPDLCDTPPRRPVLKWHPRAISAIGGCRGLHTESDIDSLFDRTTSPFRRAIDKVRAFAKKNHAIADFMLPAAGLSGDECWSLFVLASLHLHRGPSVVMQKVLELAMYSLSGGDIGPDVPDMERVLNSTQGLRETLAALSDALDHAYGRYVNRGVDAETALDQAMSDAWNLATWIASKYRYTPDFLSEPELQTGFTHSPESNGYMSAIMDGERSAANALRVLKQPAGMPNWTSDAPFVAASERGEVAALVPLGCSLWLASGEVDYEDLEAATRRMPAMTSARWLVAPEPLPDGHVLDFLPLRGQGGKPCSRARFEARVRAAGAGLGRANPHRYWARPESVAFRRAVVLN